MGSFNDTAALEQENRKLNAHVAELKMLARHAEADAPAAPAAATGGSGGAADAEGEDAAVTSPGTNAAAATAGEDKELEDEDDALEEDSDERVGKAGEDADVPKPELAKLADGCPLPAHTRWLAPPRELWEVYNPPTNLDLAPPTGLDLAGFVALANGEPARKKLATILRSLEDMQAEEIVDSMLSDRARWVSTASPWLTPFALSEGGGA